jgi:pyochelin biosynthesis protein PchC
MSTATAAASVLRPEADSIRWFRRQGRLSVPKTHLVCLPHAGGAATLYLNWADGLPLEVEVLAARYPGRQDRLLEPSIETMAELADRLTEALVPYLGEPLALFGHSLGADVAYEVTVRLEQRYGVSPRHLFVSGALAPHVAEEPELHELSDVELLREVRRLDSLGSAVLGNPELAELTLPSLRADYRLSSGYRPTRTELTTIKTPITAFTGDADPLVPVEQVRSWAELTSGTYHERVFPGGHFYLEAHSTELLGMIGARLRSLA